MADGPARAAPTGRPRRRHAPAEPAAARSPSLPERTPRMVQPQRGGEIAMTYTYAFDHANPAWQDFMARVFRYYVEEFDVDGFRVDSQPGTSFPTGRGGCRIRPAAVSTPRKRSSGVSGRVQAIKPEVVFIPKLRPVNLQFARPGLQLRRDLDAGRHAAHLSRPGCLPLFTPGHNQGSA